VILNTGETCQEWITKDITVPKMENYYKPTRRGGLLEKQSNDVLFEVPTALVTKSSISWVIILRSWLKVNQRFGGLCHLHHRG
jgi:hypothetical protein